MTGVDERPPAVGEPAGHQDLVPAQVFAEGREMRYLHGGRGRVVVILGPTEWSRELATTLLPRFRVVVPEVPSRLAAESGASGEGGTDPEARDPAWLRGFLDGTGLTPVHLVVTPDHLESVCSFVTFDPDRIQIVVALGTSAGHGRLAEFLAEVGRS